MSTGRLPSTDGGIQPTVVDAKGDLLVGVAADSISRLAVGSNDQVLTADSSTSTGLKWGTVSAGANWSLLNSGGTALTGAQTITVSGISGKDKIFILVEAASNATTNSSLFGIRFNGDTGSNYTWYTGTFPWNDTNGYPQYGASSYVPLTNNGNIAQSSSGYLRVDGCNSSGVKMYIASAMTNWQAYNAGTRYDSAGYYNSASTISSVSIHSTAGNFDAGTIYVYASA